MKIIISTNEGEVLDQITSEDLGNLEMKLAQWELVQRLLASFRLSAAKESETKATKKSAPIVFFRQPR